MTSVKYGYFSKAFKYLYQTIRRLTKVNRTIVIRLSPMGLQSMWKSSQLLGKIVMWTFKKHCGKEIAQNKQFGLLPQCFQLYLIIKLIYGDFQLT